MERGLGLTQARKTFSDLIERVYYQGDSYIINRHGKPAAAVVPVNVYENWKRQREEFFNLIRDIQTEANLSAQEAEELATEAIAAVRASTG